MIDYDNTLAFGFALGVWRGLIEVDVAIDERLGNQATSKDSLQLLDVYPHIRLIFLILWLLVVVINSHSFRGFLHLAAMPVGLYFIFRKLTFGAGYFCLELAQKFGLSGKQIRHWATVLGLIAFIGSCMPLAMTDPCNKEGAYCEPNE